MIKKSLSRKARKIKQAIIIALVTILGLGALTVTGKVLNDKYDWVQKTKDLFVKPGVQPGSSEEPTTSGSGNETSIPGDESSVPESSEPEPVLSELDKFLALPLAEDVINQNHVYFEIGIHDLTSNGLSKGSYKSSTNGSLGEYTNVEYNSLKLSETEEDVLSLRFGFPTTVNDSHRISEFNTGFTYTSYLKFNYLFHIEDEEFRFDSDKALVLYYRTEMNLTWQSASNYNHKINFNDGEQYIQCAFIYSTNNKSTFANTSYLFLNNAG